MQVIYNRILNYYLATFCTVYSNSKKKICLYSCYSSLYLKENSKVKIKQNLSKCLFILSHQMHKQMNQTLRKSIYGESHMKTGKP